MNVEDKSIPLTLREQSEEWCDKQEETDMCKELNDEREVGKLKAYGVGNHLIAMAVHRCDIPIEIDGHEIVVSAEMKPVRVPNGVSADYANGRYGERFGMDWIYEHDIPIRPEGQTLHDSDISNNGGWDGKIVEEQPRLCCYMHDATRRCDKPATVEIYDNQERRPDMGVTDSCDEHIGALLGSNPPTPSAGPWTIVALPKA